MEEVESKSNFKKYLYVLIVFSIVIGGYVIYSQNKSLKSEEANYSKSISEMNAEMLELHNEIKILKGTNKEINFKKDSLQNNMDFLWIYKTLVQASKLRDDVGTNFSFKPGDKVRLKMDSSVVIITDLVIGGNTFNYYIRFIVKNNKGVISEVSPVELENL